MTSHLLSRTALFVASKRLGGVCVGGRSSVFRHGHEDNRRIPGAGKFRQQINALGHSTFHEYDLQGRETYTWGPATYPVVQGYNAYGQRNLLRTFRDTNADFGTSIFPTTAIGDTTTWVFDEK
jgi:hypothetical protein